MSTEVRDGQRAPEKPPHRSPCNGCGLCCAAELCHVAENVLGEDAKAPCPLLLFQDGRFWCRIVLMENEAIRNGLRASPMIAQGLGIGRGCQVEDLGSAA